MKIISRMNRKGIVAAVCMILVAIFIAGRVIGANAAVSVNTVEARKGSMVKELELNGRIKSNSRVTVYSDIECRIGRINVTSGETAHKGIPVIEYDKEDVEYRLQTAQLGLESSEKEYDDRIASNGKAAGMYSQATGELKTLDEQILLYQAAILQLDDEIEKKAAALADEGAKLQISLIEWSDSPESEEYENLQKLIQSNSYEQAHNRELYEMRQIRSCYADNLAECKQKKAEMTSQKASSYTGMLTDAGREKLEADRNSVELSSSRDIEQLKSAGNGVAPDFDGIVTDIAVREGSTVAAGQELYTIESTDDIVIYCRVNRYDIGELREGQSVRLKVSGEEYSGKVSKIEKAVTEDENGVPGVGMEITPDAPDGNFILGLDAKAFVTTLSEDDILRIPAGSVYSDTDGEYVYVYKGGRAVKTTVTVGISNGDMVQIIDGLSEGDEVIDNEDDTIEITDGMEVRADKEREEK